jgi:hypothetical protein
MANQIVILGSSFSPTGDGSFSVNGFFWLTVPTNNILPVPNFKSQVSIIDPTTLSQLRAGTLFEQPFMTQYFPSGTSLAVVQTAILAQYNAAQTALTNGSAPLTGLISTEYNGSAWVQVTPTSSFDSTSNLISDMNWAAASGRVSGVSAGRATGYVATSASVSKAIIATTYTPQGTAVQRSLSSSSAADTAAGVGAQQVTIVFLDTNFVVHTEVVTLNGTTPVNMVSTNCAYVESMTVTQCGSTGTNQGTISIYTATAGGGTVWGSIAVNPGATLSGTVTTTNGSTSITFSSAQTLPAGTTLYFSGQAGVGYTLASAVTASTTGTLTANFTGTGGSGQTVQTGAGDNQTFYCHHYVPAGVTCYVLSVECASYSVVGTMYLAMMGNPSATNAPAVQIGPTVLHPAGDYREHYFTTALAVTGPNRIVLFTRPSTSTSDTSLGNFEYIQF